MTECLPSLKEKERVFLIMAPISKTCDIFNAVICFPFNFKLIFWAKKIFNRFQSGSSTKFEEKKTYVRVEKHLELWKDALKRIEINDEC